MTDAAEARVPLRRNAAYLLLMTSRTAQILGNGIGLFAVPLLAFALTGSVVTAGLLAAVGEVGALLVTLPGGVVADRVDRRRLLLLSSLIGAVLWLSVVITDAAGVLTAVQLGAVLFGSSVVGALIEPADVAGIRMVIRVDQLGSAMAAVQGRSAVAALVAGPVGGLLYAITRSLPALGATLGYVVAGATVAFVRRPLNDEHPNTDHPVAALREGLRFVGRSAVLRTIVLLALLINLGAAGLMITINLYLVSIGTRPLLIGALDAVAGGTMIIGAVLAGPLVSRVASGLVVAGGLVVSLVGVIGIALSSTYPAYLGWLAVIVIFVPAINAVVLGYAAAVTPPALQGRMSSVLAMAGVTVAPIAPAVAGLLLGHFGVTRGLLSFAACFAVGVALAVASRPIRTIGRPDTWSEASA